MSMYTVIGAPGFIGGLLVGALRARGDNVYTPSRGDPELLSRDLGRVFYCAGLTGDFINRPYDTVDAHVRLLTDLIRIGRFDRLIYLSSTRLYDSLGAPGGQESDSLVFDVSSPRSVYDLSKALGENLCLTYSEGRGAVARLSNVFDMGVHCSGFLPDLMRRAQAERSISLSSSPNVGRDYVHASDVIAALLAMDARAMLGIVNIASGNILANAQLASIFDDAGWRLNLTGNPIRQDYPACDTTKLRALGVLPQDVSQILPIILKSPNFFIGKRP